jgi:pimeloyl-ACP methyl ester carboxylesterase
MRSARVRTPFVRLCSRPASTTAQRRSCFGVLLSVALRRDAAAMRHARTALLLLAALLTGTSAAQPRATESGFIQVEPDVRIFYQRFGTGTPALFIPMRSELVTTFAPLLERVDAVLWDARGTGLSDRPDDMGRYGIDVEIADAERIRTHFGAERIYYVGGSWWANVAMLYAARHPSSVAGVVAMAPMAVEQHLMFGRPERTVFHSLTPERVEHLRMQGDGRRESEPYAYCLIDHRLGFSNSYVDLANFSKFEAANLCQYANWRPDAFGQVWVEGIRPSFGRWDWRDELATVEAPVVVVFGDHEPWPLVGVRAYAEVLPNVALVEFEDTGHHVWNERDEEVLAIIEAFLGGTWPMDVKR